MPAELVQAIVGRLRKVIYTRLRRGQLDQTGLTQAPVLPGEFAELLLCSAPSVTALRVPADNPTSSLGTIPKRATSSRT